MFILYFIQADELDEQWLKRLEASLRSFGTLPKNSRFCLADYSTQPSVPEELISNFSIDYLHYPAPLPFNRSWSINYAYKKFVQDYDTHFLFTDIDLIFPPDFLVHTTKILGQINGIVIPKLFYLTHESSKASLTYIDLSVEKSSAWRTFYSGSCFCPITLFEEVHGFDEMYIGWGAEDNDFINRILSVNAEVIKALELEVLHLDHPRTAEQNDFLVKKNRARLTQKESGNIILIDDTPWGEEVKKV